MDNSKFLKTVIIILLFINMGTLAFMWINNSNPSQPREQQGDPMSFLINELNLSDAQQLQLDELRHQHRDRVKPLRAQSRQLHDRYFEMLANTATDSLTVSQAADAMVAIQKQIELATYYHFKQVRAICTPAQQQKFDDLVADALHKMARNPPGK